jgi:hypothetical protein
MHKGWTALQPTLCIVSGPLTLSEIQQLPDLIGRCLIRVAALEGVDDLGDQFVGHHQLHLPLLDQLDLAGLPEVRLAAVQWAELALAKRLPGAVVIVADASAASGEHSGLDHLDMAAGDEEGELVHP